MAVLPSVVRSNPNASALVAGTAAGVAAYGIFEQEPLTSVVIGAGSALLTRGLIHLDTTTHTFKVGGSKVVIAEIGDDKFEFSGTLDMKDMDAFPDKLLSQLSAKAPVKAKKTAA